MVHTTTGATHRTTEFINLVTLNFLIKKIKYIYSHQLDELDEQKEINYCKLLLGYAAIMENNFQFTQTSIVCDRQWKTWSELMMDDLRSMISVVMMSFRQILIQI